MGSDPALCTDRGVKTPLFLLKGIAKKAASYVTIGGIQMRTMKIEKLLEMDEPVLAVHQLKVEEDLRYERQSDGIHASGPVYISGSWSAESGTYPISEVLEFDVLAPQEKLSGEAFHLDMISVKSEILHDQIVIEIAFAVSGLIEEEKNAPALREESEQEEAKTQKQDEAEMIDVSESFEDLLEDDNSTHTTYRFIVARKNDTYAAIAQRYAVAEADLREVNHHKEIPYKTLVLLP